VKLRKAIALLVAALPCWAADSVPADTSGNALLKGKYWVREILPLAHNAFWGAITFDGNGAYTFTGQSLEEGKTRQVTLNGTYRVGANGIASVDNLSRASQSIVDTSQSIMLGAVGLNGVLTGSDTEGDFNDLLVAIPAGTTVPQSSALQGAYWIGHLDYGPGNNGPITAPQAGRNSLFQVTADGKGGFADVTVTGHDVTQNDKQLSQVVRSANYNFVSDGSASLSFPAPAGIAAAASLFTGTKTLYLSGDGNYVLGGDPNGYDIFFGFHPLTSGATASDAYFGVYYFADINSDVSDPSYPVFESSYGSINAFHGLKAFFHKRASPFNDVPYDFNFGDAGETLSTDGSLATDLSKTVVGMGGRVIMTVGKSTNYALVVGSLAPTVPSSGVFLNPLGILNAASYSPITAGVSPGELITIFGSNLSSSTATANIPFPTSLAGVQVMINDRPAPVYAVSPGQLSAIVPYATSGTYAKIQVINNGKTSNPVTMYNRSCSPAVFTLSAGGDGYGAVLHANYQVANAANPAKLGEVVLIYATGLGAVNPTVTDGSPGPTSPLSTVNGKVGVFFGSTTGLVLYQGLAPGLAGLYQLNVQIPSDAPTGDVLLDVEAGGNSLTCIGYQATIQIVKAN
jgi:uncharacterized protein (TIGR03437 family)